ncbi:hypothetical protein PEBR_32005 [Penicillium brasilianum]|uniref:CFEM domain-containing protein n=1 Tax=Penicillium brasilianum TaxID=104259 RepID=A0A1S9REZ3_PENBI|nr:hypothetical protein PEBR_32005 [Penicillium brasilianum]
MKPSILAPLAVLFTVAMAGTPDNPENMTPCLLKCNQQAAEEVGCGTYLNTDCTCASDPFVLALNTCLSARCDATDVKMSKDLHVKICHGTPV